MGDKPALSVFQTIRDGTTPHLLGEHPQRHLSGLADALVAAHGGAERPPTAAAAAVAATVAVWVVVQG